MLVSPADLVAVAKATITECSVTEVERCLDSDTLLIDIREPAEYRNGHIPGAVPLARGMLEFEIHRLADGYFEIWARATDSAGRAQPMVLPGWNPKGYLNNACHRIAVQVA